MGMTVAVNNEIPKEIIVHPTCNEHIKPKKKEPSLFVDNDGQVYQQKQYNRCLRCGRKLKTLENRTRGYGKVCWEKQKRKNAKKLFTI